MKSRAALLFSVVSLMAGALNLLGTVGASPAQAGPTGLVDYTGMAVDRDAGLAYITQGNGSATVLVVNGNGALVRSIPVAVGLYSPALDATGETLYAGLDGDSIVGIDLASGDVTTYPVCADCVSRIAETQGIVFFSTYSDVHALDTATGDYTEDVYTEEDGDLIPSTSPDRPGELFVQTGFISNDGYVAAFDVVVDDDGPSLVQRARRDFGFRDAVLDLAFTHDGERLLMTGDYAGGVALVLDADDLTKTGSYAITGGRARGLDLRADGMAAVYDDTGSELLEIFVTPTKRYRHYFLGDVIEDSIAFVGSRNLLWVSEEPGIDAIPSLHVLTPKAATNVQVKLLTKRPVAGQRMRVQVTGVQAGRKIVVSLLEKGQPERQAATGMVPAGDVLTINVRVRRSGVLRVTALADATHDAGKQSRRLAVRGKVAAAMKGFRAKQGTVHLYGSRSDAVIQGRLAPGRTDACLVFRAQFKVRGRWGYDATTKCVPLAASGTARGFLTGDPRLVGIPVRMRAEWRGDKVNLANESAWQFVRFVGSGRASADRRVDRPGVRIGF